MSPKNQDDRSKKSKSNASLNSSIVHKPFATGTINIFNPHRTKGSKSDSQLAAPKLYLNAELEKSDPLATFPTPNHEPDEVAYHESDWLNRLLNPWCISAIAMIFLVNLVSGAVIWRNHRATSNIEPIIKPVATLGSANLATEEFMPLNLSTLSRLKTAEDGEESVVIEPISPALAPINLAQSTINPEYYYILTEYTGDASLAKARQQVEQISLVNFPQGVFIYLGAYQDRDQADQYLNHLETVNFSARIYPFD